MVVPRGRVLSSPPRMRVMMNDLQAVCPHCGASLVRWANPPNSTWTGEFQYVCFNDQCPYFVRGWKWMKDSYNVDASYRYRVDPETGEAGPLPVWSREALKSGIIAGEEARRAG